MTTVGLLHTGHIAEDDYRRIETLLGTDIRVPAVRLGGPDGPDRAGRLAEATEELRLAGAESVVWACTRETPAYTGDGAHERIRELAVAAGLPASNTAFAFAHAVRAVGAARVAVAAAYPPPLLEPFVRFLEASGVEVVGAVAAGPGADGDAPAEVPELVRAAAHPAAQAVLVPDAALSTVAHLPELEAAAGRPVLTANQVTVWEGLRLAERRDAWSTELGALFARRE